MHACVFCVLCTHVGFCMLYKSVRGCFCVRVCVYMKEFACVCM